MKKEDVEVGRSQDCANSLAGSVRAQLQVSATKHGRTDVWNQMYGKDKDFFPRPRMLKDIAQERTDDPARLLH